jgi:hypothetical protein
MGNFRNRMRDMDHFDRRKDLDDPEEAIYDPPRDDDEDESSVGSVDHGRASSRREGQRYSGHLEIGDERYPFDQGIAAWDGHVLTVYGVGEDLLVVFDGIPFPGAKALSEIDGVEYSGDSGEAPYSESLVRLHDVNLLPDKGLFRCIAASSKKSLVSIEFELLVLDAETGRYRDISGAIRCRIGEIPEWSFD